MNNPYPYFVPRADWTASPQAQPVWPPGTYPTAAPPAPYGMPTAYPMGVPGQAPPTGSVLTNPRFIKGALVGAVAAYLLTNDNVQQAAIKSAVKVWSMLQGGVEEMKERFRDAEAELHATQAQDPE